MATTRLKMVVNTVAKSARADDSGEISHEEITMSAVFSNKEDAANKQWSKWTPAGQLKFSVSNEAVFDRIKPGQFYYVDLIQTDKDSL